MKRVWWVAVVSFVLLVLASFASSRSFGKEPEAQTLSIGLITSITGPLAPALRALGDAAEPASRLCL